MKNLLLVLNTLVFVLTMNAQNEPAFVSTIDQHPGSANFIYIDHGLPKMLVSSATSAELYNMDQSLFLSFAIPDAPFENAFPFVGYVTRSLFDCDSTNIEFLVSFATVDTSNVRVFREDGTEYFDFGNVGIFAVSGLDQLLKPIISDSEGSYIRFGNSVGGTDIFALCGQVPQPLARSSDGTILSGIMEQENNYGFDAYPNPAREIIKFEYDLQGHKKANLQLFNTSGQLMKELMLGQAFDFIRLNISDLEQGTYIARITTDDGFELSEKFVKVD